MSTYSGFIWKVVKVPETSELLNVPENSELSTGLFSDASQIMKGVL